VGSSLVEWAAALAATGWPVATVVAPRPTAAALAARGLVELRDFAFVA